MNFNQNFKILVESLKGDNWNKKFSNTNNTLDLKELTLKKYEEK